MSIRKENTGEENGHAFPGVLQANEFLRRKEIRKRVASLKWLVSICNPLPKLQMITDT